MTDLCLHTFRLFSCKVDKCSILYLSSLFRYSCCVPACLGFVFFVLRSVYWKRMLSLISNVILFRIRFPLLFYICVLSQSLAMKQLFSIIVSSSPVRKIGALSLSLKTSKIERKSNLLEWLLLSVNLQKIAVQMLSKQNCSIFSFSVFLFSNVFNGESRCYRPSSSAFASTNPPNITKLQQKSIKSVHHRSSSNDVIASLSKNFVQLFKIFLLSGKNLPLLSFLTITRGTHVHRTYAYKDFHYKFKYLSKYFVKYIIKIIFSNYCPLLSILLFARIGGTLVLASIAFSAYHFSAINNFWARRRKGGSMTPPRKRSVICKFYTIYGCCIREECVRPPQAANKHLRSGPMPCLCPIFANPIFFFSNPLHFTRDCSNMSKEV